MRLSVSFFICFLIGISGYTQNDSGLTEVLKQLNLKEGHIKSEFVRIKALPHRPEDVIYLIPEIIEEDDNYSYTLHPHIVIVDINSHIIKSTYHYKEKWESDALYLSEVTIDTAPYWVNDDQRAFGIRVSYIGSSKPNPYSATNLCLYVIENNTIRRVLNNLETDGYWGEWDTTCYGEFTDSKCILIINDHQTNGYNDLLIKCTNTETKAYPADEQKYDKDPFNIECLESKKTSTFKGIVTYSNGIYQLKH